MNTPASPHNRKKTEKSQETCIRIPFFITSLSSMSRVVLPKDHIIAFITPENPETNYIEIAEVQSIEEQCRNWKCPTKMLPKAPESNFLVSPGDVKEVKRCMLPESNISDETHKSFCQLLNKYQAAFLSSSEDRSHRTHYNRHWYSYEPTCIPETIYPTIEASWLGHWKESQSMGQPHSHCTKEVWPRRASQEEDVCGLLLNQCPTDWSWL